MLLGSPDDSSRSLERLALSLEHGVPFKLRYRRRGRGGLSS